MKNVFTPPIVIALLAALIGVLAFRYLGSGLITQKNGSDQAIGRSRGGLAAATHIGVDHSSLVTPVNLGTLSLGALLNLGVLLVEP